MKIEFKTVRYKNLLSSGNSWTTIPLNESRTTLISGTNGSGKSTLLDAIVFGLYGKAFRKINKINLSIVLMVATLLLKLTFRLVKTNTWFVVALSLLFLKYGKTAQSLTKMLRLEITNHILNKTFLI